MTELYRPSSGTEGEWFIGQWCGNCERDKCQNGSKPMDECTQDDFCQIIGKTMWLDVDDPDYPKEWIEDEEDGPRCTAFIEKGKDIPPERCEQTEDMFQKGGAA